MPATKKPAKTTKPTTTTKKPRKGKNATKPGDEAFARMQELVQGGPVQPEAAPAETKPAAKKAGAKVAKTTPAPEPTPALEIIDAGGGILVEIAPPPAKAAKAEAKPKKLSALDAAAKVLAESGEPMNTKAMIDAMAAKGLWTSPGGKTPHATLYSAILREIGTKKDESRFRKTTKGHFTATTA